MAWGRCLKVSEPVCSKKYKAESSAETWRGETTEIGGERRGEGVMQQAIRDVLAGPASSRSHC